MTLPTSLAAVACYYPLNHPATAGHFVGHPIIPGVVILADVLTTVASHMRTGILPAINENSYRLRAAKFLRPVVPGQEMMIGLRAIENTENTNTDTDEKTPSTLVIHFDCSVDSIAVAKGSFEFVVHHD
jgi:3-hydroxymyristoyl/3-hydroxydecanoyl-(acyl carrier protein) dehydratase